MTASEELLSFRQESFREFASLQKAKLDFQLEVKKSHTKSLSSRAECPVVWGRFEALPLHGNVGTTGWFGLKGTFRGHLISCPDRAVAFFTLFVFVQTPSKLKLNVSRNRAATTSLVPVLRTHKHLLLKTFPLFSFLVTALYVI